MNTHNTQILEYLKSGQSITPLDALRMFGTMRLGARIWDLRHGVYDGIHYAITEEPEPNTTGKGKHAKYSLRVSDRGPVILSPRDPRVADSQCIAALH